jgi:hypothetical protein
MCYDFKLEVTAYDFLVPCICLEKRKKKKEKEKKQELFHVNCEKPIAVVYYKFLHFQMPTG